MAPYSATAISQTRHFLYLLPSDTTEWELEVVVNSARRLTERGHVYIASAHTNTMEDSEGIRFMPLSGDVLPSFTSVTSVCVLRDQSLAQKARRAYPGLEVLVFDPPESPSPPVGQGRARSNATC